MPACIYRSYFGGVRLNLSIMAKVFDECAEFELEFKRYVEERKQII